MSRNDYLPVLDHQIAIANDRVHVGDVLQAHVRPAAYHDDIGEFPRFECSQFVGHIEDFGIGPGRGDQDFWHGEPGGGEILHLIDVRRRHVPKPLENQVRPDAQLDACLFEFAQHLQVCILREGEAAGSGAEISAELVKDNLIRDESGIGGRAFPRHQLDSLLAARERMLDGIYSGFHSPLDVNRFRVGRNFQPQRMRFFDSSGNFRLRQMAADFDEVRAARKLLAHGLAPGVRPGGQARGAFQEDQIARQALGGMAAGGGNELSGGKTARPRNAVLRYPFLQAKWHVALRTNIADAGDAELQEETELFCGAKRGIGVANGVSNVRRGSWIAEVRMEVNQPRKNGFPGDFENARTGGPIGGIGREDFQDFVALNDQGALTGGRARTVENAAAAQNEGALWTARTRRNGDAARIVGRRRIRAEILSAVLQLLLPGKGGRNQKENYTYSRERLPEFSNFEL